LATVLAVALSGCGRDAKSAAGPTTTSTSAAVTSTTSAQEAALVDAWRHYWEIYVAVGSEMKLPDARLAQVATGDELRQLGSAFLADATQGHLIKGTIDLDPKVVSVDATSATLRDCYMSHILVVDRASGQPTGAGSTQRTLVTATFMLESGVWKVAGIRHEGDGCTSV
jgi:hypothetical protein